MLSVLSVLLGALKVVGAVLLFILKLLLLVLLFLIMLLFLFLFVPFRYRVEAALQRNKFTLKSDVTFLLKLLRVRITMDKEMNYTVKLGFFILFSSLKKEKRKKKKRKKGKKKKKETVSVSDAKTEQSGDKRSERPDRKASESVSEEKMKASEKEEEADVEIGAKEQKKSSTEQEKEKTEEKDFSKRPEEKALKVKAVGEKIKTGASSVAERVTDASSKKDAVFRFLNAEGTAEAFGLLFKEGGKLLKAVLPKKLEGRLRFGTGDVYTEGKYLSYLCLLYGLYGEHLVIEPEWEEKVIEFDVLAVGRIRLFTILRICIKVFFNKNFKKLRKNIDELKKGLGID